MFTIRSPIDGSQTDQNQLTDDASQGLSGSPQPVAPKPATLPLAQAPMDAGQMTPDPMQANAPSVASPAPSSPAASAPAAGPSPYMPPPLATPDPLAFAPTNSNMSGMSGFGQTLALSPSPTPAAAPPPAPAAPAPTPPGISPTLAANSGITTTTGEAPIATPGKNQTPQQAGTAYSQLALQNLNAGIANGTIPANTPGLSDAQFTQLLDAKLAKPGSSVRAVVFDGFGDIDPNDPRVQAWMQSHGENPTAVANQSLSQGGSLESTGVVLSQPQIDQYQPPTPPVQPGNGIITEGAGMGLGGGTVGGGDAAPGGGTATAGQGMNEMHPRTPTPSPSLPGGSLGGSTLHPTSPFGDTPAPTDGNGLPIHTMPSTPSTPTLPTVPPPMTAQGPSAPGAPGAPSTPSPTPPTDPNGLPHAPGVSLSPTTPGNSLLNQTITPGPAADRYAIAKQQYDDWVTQSDPQFQAANRDAIRSAAAAGAIGSGQLNTSLGDLELNRENDIRSKRDTFLGGALNSSIDDAYKNLGIAQQQQQFQAGQQQTGFNQQVTLQSLSDSEQGQQFQQYMSSLGFNAQQIQQAFQNAYAVQQMSNSQDAQSFYEALQKEIQGNSGDPAQILAWISGQFARGPNLQAA